MLRFPVEKESEIRSILSRQEQLDCWMFINQTVNPDAKGTLKKVINAVNGLRHQSEFIVFTGDLTHTTDDDGSFSL